MYRHSIKENKIYQLVMGLQIKTSMTGDRTRRRHCELGQETHDREPVESEAMASARYVYRLQT